MTKSKRIRLNCLINASSSAEYLNNNKEACDLLVQAAKMKASLNEPIKDITESLEKAYSLIAKEDLEKFGEVVGPLMIFKIANQDYGYAKRLYRKIKELKQKNTSNKFALKVFDILISNPEAVWNSKENFLKFPSNFPNEFKNYVKTIQEVILNSAALTITMETNRSQIKAGEPLKITSRLKNYAPMSISKIILNSGSKGTVTADPEFEFPKNLSNKDEIVLQYELQAQLTGTWHIGPLTANYMIGGKSYIYKSDTITTEVLEGEKSVAIQLSHSIIDEDFEYEIFGEIVNNGKSDLDNITLSLKVPKDGKITLGTKEKKIFELRKGESLKFSNNVKFEAGTLGKEYTIKMKEEYEGGEAENGINITELQAKNKYGLIRQLTMDNNNTLF